ncbi:hypothetical protein [Leuconostoc mesenteroides]|uniref:hypothetical protein n=1 Tax=Leuconostoc mesenteroides TaxID=1245 RepID=UPI0010AE80FB|nr:hypothetical protein [Leuconostoc mesenteroides]TJY27365.1 hypothetical protein FCF26_09460 [Leuconostoc mesenteroides subsp. mesenteroides]
MKRTAEWFLYITSLFPLYILILVQNFLVTDFNGHITKLWGIVSVIESNFLNTNLIRFCVMWIVVLLIVISLISQWLISCQYKKLIVENSQDTTKPEIKIKQQNLDRVDTMSYVGTYIVPLLTININSLRTVIVNVLLLIFLGKFYVMNGQIFINPLFNIGGFSIYRAGDIYIITKNDIDIISDTIVRKKDVFSKEIMHNLFLMRVS